MESLPIEILENILGSHFLSIKDIVNFSTTCRHFRDIVSGSNALWKQKFKDKWPDLSHLFSSNHSFYSEVQYAFNFGKTIQKMLEEMPSRFCKKYILSEPDLEEWNEPVKQNEKNYWYLVAYLMDIVNNTDSIDSPDVVPLSVPGNKTLQYYAGKVLRHIRQLYLHKEWLKFRSLEPREQLLEHGAVFVAQWCQPNIDVSKKNIGQQLDSIAKKVLIRLKEVVPNHSIFNASEQQFKQWSSYKLEANQWKPLESKQIMMVLRDVLYDDLRFRGNNDTYYMPENSYINEVLDKRKGLPITLAIIFESVARRLGLKCDPICFPSHFLLRFSEDGNDFYYIDVFNSGNTYRRGTCPYARRKAARGVQEHYPAASTLKVIERMANNVEVSARQFYQVNGKLTRIRSSLELLTLVAPQDISALVSLARHYMLHSVDTRPLERYLLEQEFDVPEQAHRVAHMIRDFVAHNPRSRPNPDEPVAPVEANRRTSDLKFAVGMVMIHLTLDYKCVIYEWDPSCLADVDWQNQMGVSALKLGTNQPFYNVLVEDGSHRYVAQENLKPTTDVGDLSWNDDVGRHFSHFYKTHYVPNADKEKEYPQDKGVRLFFHQRYEGILNDRKPNSN